MTPILMNADIAKFEADAFYHRKKKAVAAPMTLDPLE